MPVILTYRILSEQFSDEDSSIDDGSRLEDESRPGSPSEVRDGAAETVGVGMEKI